LVPVAFDAAAMLLPYAVWSDTCLSTVPPPLGDFDASSDVPPAADALAVAVDTALDDAVKLTTPPDAVIDRVVVAVAESFATLTAMPIPAAVAPADFAPAFDTVAPV
jgi:hypothetical protein